MANVSRALLSQLSWHSTQLWSVDAKGCITSQMNPVLHLTVLPRGSRHDLEQRVVLELRKESGSKQRQDQIFNFALSAPVGQVCRINNVN